MTDLRGPAAGPAPPAPPTPTDARVVGVHVGRAVTRTWGGVATTTAIVKSPITGTVEVGPDGLLGDQRAARAHAGPYHAVYVYALEDYAAWSARLGRHVAPATFGENLTVRDVDVGGAQLGERWRVGSALLEVCGPRIPCQTFARRMGEPDWIKRFTDVGATGCYLRVIETGTLEVESPVLVQPVDPGRNPGAVTVLDAFRALTAGRPAALMALADVEALRPDVRSRARAARERTADDVT